MLILKEIKPIYSLDIHEMVGWHHQLNGHEFEETPGVGDGQGGLACYRPRGCKESDTTEWLNNNRKRGFVRWLNGSMKFCLKAELQSQDLPC